MFLLENVCIFVRFSQFFSFLPYYIEKNRGTNQFKQIAFSWKNPTTWWFISLTVLQIAFFVWRWLKSWQFNHDEGVLVLHVPPIFGFVIPMEVLFIMVMTDFLRKAQKVIDDNIPKKDVEAAGRAIKRRSMLGLIWVIVLSSIFMAASSRQIYIFAQRDGIFVTVVSNFFWFISFGLLVLFIAFMDLSYYTVGQYIHLLSSHLRSISLAQILIIESATLRIKGSEYDNWKGIMKKAKEIFGYLCAASTELNTVLSFPVFLFLLTRLFLSSLLMYISIYGVMSDNEFLKEMLPLTVTICLIGCTNIFVILRSADLPINQIKLLYEIIFTLTSEHDVGQEGDLEALSLIHRLSEDPIRLSAAGLFQVGMHQLPSITASIVTYLIVLLQANLA